MAATALGVLCRTIDRLAPRFDDVDAAGAVNLCEPRFAAFFDVVEVRGVHHVPATHALGWPARRR